MTMFTYKDSERDCRVEVGHPDLGTDGKYHVSWGESTVRINRLK
jgi:hypothetical protein